MTGDEFAENALKDITILDKDIVTHMVASAFEAGKIAGQGEYARELLAKGANIRKVKETCPCDVCDTLTACVVPLDGDLLCPACYKKKMETS